MSELMELQKVEPVVFTEAKQLETAEDTKEDVKDVVVEPKEELKTEPKTEEDADPLAGGINIDDDELKETLDELQCIKKELADIKKDPVAIDNATGSDDNKEKIKKEEEDKKEIKLEDGADATESTEPNPDDSLGRDDLIAMLKGCEETQEKSVTTATSNAKPSDLTEDVEIEGEGSFQIMEVVDDDLEPEGDEIEAPSTAPPIAATKTNVTSANVAPAAPKLPTSSANVKTITLTLEQERAIAMEQMADISAKRFPRGKAPAASSTAAAPAPSTVAAPTAAAAAGDAKTVKEEKKGAESDKTSSLSLLQVLGADWSDDDAHHDKATKLQTKAVTTTKPKVAKSIKKEPIPSNKAATTIAVVTKDTTTVVKASGAAAAKTKSIELEQQQKSKEKPVITSVVVLNQSPNKNKIENGTDAKETKQPAGAAGSATQSPGFKRQRIIKRKIIWDPDAPETAISYAQLARSSTSKPTAATSAVKQQQTVKQQTVVAATAAVKKEPVAVGTTTATVLKKVAVIKQESKKPASPTTSVHSADGTEIVVETVGGRKVIKQLNESLGSVTKSPLVFDDNRCQTPAGKRRSQTPIANGALSKKKKISEVDRLMGDEGAINMLNAVEHELNNKQKDNKEVGGEVTPETSPKHNMRSRAGAEKGATKRDASASSQKKDTPMPSKAKRQPRSKASATWDYVYQTQQDEAMIIRRRSNSSYSSNASLHRLSLDGGPSPITPRVEQKKPAATTKAKAKTAAAAASTSTTSTASPASSSSPSTVAGTSSKKSSFEFAKPKNKTAAAAAAASQTPTTPTTPKVNRRGNAKSNAAAAAGTLAQLSNDSPKSSELKLTTPLRNVPGNIDFIVSVAVHKFDDIWQLEFNSKATKFSVEMLDQLTDAFNRLRTADDCSVVVMSTTRTNFCQGVDLSDLLTENAEKRLNVAAEIASSTKAYLKALATFPKPIVAAVNGNVSGLGVIQLLLLDAVIAGDKSSYDTSIYNRIGQVPEGYCIWENDRKISKNLFKKLLWFGEKVSAYEAHSWGLLHKIMPATGVLEEAKTLAKKLASSYMYNEMKQRSIDRFMSEVNDVLDKEFETIVEQLASEEALENLKKI